MVLETTPRVERCEDIAVVDGIFRHPEVWPWVCDDNTEDSEVSFGKAIMDRTCVVYVAWSGDQPMAAFTFMPRNSVMVELHSAVLPEARGAWTALAFGDAVRQVFDSGFCKIVTYVPVNNQRAYKKALAVGFQIEGYLKLSFLRDGLLWDQWVLGMNRKES